MIGYNDLAEAKRLRTVYNRLLERKETFVNTALGVSLNPEQKAEADLTLAMITGELKRLDASIQAIGFRGAIGFVGVGPEAEAMSFLSIAKRMAKQDLDDLRDTIEKQKDHIVNLSRKIGNVRNQLNHYKYTKSKKYVIDQHI